MDYSYTEDEILIEATLIFPDDDSIGGPYAERVKADMKRLCPAGRKICHASLGNNISVIFAFNENKRLPDRKTLIAAFREACAMRLYHKLVERSAP